MRKTAEDQRARPRRLPEEFAALRRLLEARLGKQGKREFVQVLRLMEAFRIEEVTLNAAPAPPRYPPSLREPHSQAAAIDCQASQFPCRHVPAPKASLPAAARLPCGSAASGVATPTISLGSTASAKRKGKTDRVNSPFPLPLDYARSVHAPNIPTRRA
jgi:hypothetical protein